jgi:hypothetical protein
MQHIESDGLVVDKPEELSIGDYDGDDVDLDDEENILLHRLTLSNLGE